MLAHYVCTDIQADTDTEYTACKWTNKRVLFKLLKICHFYDTLGC